MRRVLAQVRRAAIAKALVRTGLSYGVQSKLAAEFGVSEATISRDMKDIRKYLKPCPQCGRYGIGERRVVAPLIEPDA